MNLKAKINKNFNLITGNKAFYMFAKFWQLEWVSYANSTVQLVEHRVPTSSAWIADLKARLRATLEVKLQVELKT